MIDFWNERYSQTAYAYGETPNEYFKSKLALMPVGKILMPAEGEGRNAVFAATLGWDVVAFDNSSEGKKKAILLAQKQKVTIDYRVEDMSSIVLEDATFDAIGLCFAHFPPATRTIYHQKLAKALKKGGVIIMEAFSKDHATFQVSNPLAGGPLDEQLRYDFACLKLDFCNFEIIEAYQTETTLLEGLYHQGEASVVRLFIKKK